MVEENKNEFKETENSVETIEAASNKKKGNGARLLIRILVVVAIIVVGVFLILWIVSRAAKYEIIGAMLDHMFGELDLMWKRINN